MIFKILAGFLLVITGTSACAISPEQALLDRSKYSWKEGFNNENIYSNGEAALLLKTLINLPQPTLFDVGANVGVWSDCAITCSPQARIYAFEPHPLVFQQLANNTKGKNVQCFNLGLHNKKDTLPLFCWEGETPKEDTLSQLDGLHFRPILINFLKKPCKTINVDLVTLDEFCQAQQIDHIDYLKIDTEGNEWNVLQGGKELIANHCIDMIQFEYGGCYLDSKTTLKTVYEFLTSSGYDVFRILPGGFLYPLTTWDDSLENYQLCNCIAKWHK